MATGAIDGSNQTFNPSINNEDAGGVAPAPGKAPVGKGNLAPDVAPDGFFTGTAFDKARAMSMSKPTLPAPAPSPDGKKTVTAQSQDLLAQIEAALAAGINSPEEATQLLAVVSAAMLDLKAQGLAVDNAGKSKQLEANRDAQLKKIAEAQEKAQKVENKGFWAKLWGVIKAVASVIASVAMLVVATVTVNPVLFVMAGFMLYNSVIDTINSVRAAQGKEPLDLNFTLGKGLVLLLDKMGIVDKGSKTAQWLQIGIDVAAALATAVYTFYVPGAMSAAISKIANLTQAIASGIGAVAGIGQGVVNMDIADYKYEANVAKLDQKELMVQYQRLQAIMQQLIDILQNTEKAKLDILGGASESLNQRAKVATAVFNRNYS
jgi:hypothetical protein